MNKQRIDGVQKKTTTAIKENTAKPIGNRHMQSAGEAEKTDGRIGSGVVDALDAVREVVNNEK